MPKKKCPNCGAMVVRVTPHMRSERCLSFGKPKPIEMDPRPPSLIEGTRKQNPEYTKWYNRNLSEAQREKRRKDANHFFHNNKHKSLAYRAKYRKKNRSKIRRSGRKYYQRTKVHKKERHLVRLECESPSEKASRRKRDGVSAKSRCKRNAQSYQKARILRQKGKKTERKPGYVYFFKSITPGYYKAGCTIDWKKRSRGYSGPAAVEKLYFCRPVPDRFYAETQLKIFLENAGYKPVGKSNRRRICDWFVIPSEKVF
jgi:hypothetical protein